MQDNKYKVVLRVDEGSTGDAALRWSPGCPLQITAVQVSRDTTSGEAYLQLKLENVSSDVVSSFELVATCAFADGTEERVVVNPLDADIAPKASYTPQAARLLKGDVSSVTATVSKARFGLVAWSSSGEEEAFPEPPALELNEDEMRERELLLLESGIPQEYAASMSSKGLTRRDGWYQCACGQVNVGRSACCRCGLSLESAEAFQDAGYLDGKAAERAAAAEASKAKAAATKKRIIMACVAVAIAAAAAGVGKVIYDDVIRPRNDYNAALELMESGDFDRAREAFEALGDYEDSSEKVTEAETSAAEKAYDAGDYASAAERFEALGLDERAKDAKYQHAMTNLAEPDRNTYTFLKELSEEEYLDSAELFDENFAWKFRIVPVEAGFLSKYPPIRELDPGEAWPFGDSSAEHLYLMIEIQQGNAFESATLLVVDTTDITSLDYSEYKLTFSLENGKYSVDDLWRTNGWPYTGNGGRLENGNLYFLSIASFELMTKCTATVTDSETGEVIYSMDKSA